MATKNQKVTIEVLLVGAEIGGIISDIASAPVDALAQMEGTYPGPKTVGHVKLELRA